MKAGYETRQWCLAMAFQNARDPADTKAVIEAAEAIYAFVCRPTIH